ncbi:DUF3862 domain-containing protein [Secundilactobacillus mixtipabuli]|uniref:DUF3862 domain-containing protein n=1 Tax=Secundilactobacillus mixtipabuli TaxID=1435342 RepID=A0A1Z5I9T1_9LACO|nr:DUF3862 domain-containing protein [Secundilactobacillus mixtipabuli]GAW98566.1 hypothetical protein IWT30_00513 [Secundilactobacillus mixtipabuli]
MKKRLMVANILMIAVFLSACGAGASKTSHSTTESESSQLRHSRAANQATVVNSKMQAKFKRIKTGDITSGVGGSSKAEVCAIMGKPDKISKANQTGTNKNSQVYTWVFLHRRNKRLYNAISIDFIRGKTVSKNAFHTGTSSKISTRQYQQIKKGDHLDTVRKQLGTPIEEMVMGSNRHYGSQTLVYLDENNQKTYTFNFSQQRLLGKTPFTSKGKPSHP